MKKAMAEQETGGFQDNTYCFISYNCCKVLSNLTHDFALIASHKLWEDQRTLSTNGLTSLGDQGTEEEHNHLTASLIFSPSVPGLGLENALGIHLLTPVLFRRASNMERRTKGASPIYCQELLSKL